MTKKDINLAYALELEPKEALEYFENKGYILPEKLSQNWEKVWQEAHAKAFTVARVTQMDILQDIRKMVNKSLKEGITFEQFKKELMPTLQKKGWWGITKDENGNDVQLGSVRRLKTIYSTNLRTAYMAGRYKAMADNTPNRPYWMYDAKDDKRTRPAHKALDKKVFRFDDPFWDTHFPPNGWRCRCNVRALNENNLKDKKLKVESSKNKIEKKTVILSGEEKTVSIFKTADKAGNPVKVQTDAGWDYNVGKAAYQPNLENYPTKIAKDYCKGIVTGKPFEQFYEKTLSMSLDNIKQAPQTFPIAVLNDEYKNILKANSKVVLVSNETLKKQFTKHSELSLADYILLPDFIEKAEVITQEDENKLIFLKNKDLYRLMVIKSTKDKNELYLVSYFITSLKELKKRLKRGKVIKNNLEQ